jgi:hypothetical protein
VCVHTHTHTHTGLTQSHLCNQLAGASSLVTGARAGAVAAQDHAAVTEPRGDGAPWWSASHAAPEADQGGGKEGGKGQDVTATGPAPATASTVPEQPLSAQELCGLARHKFVWNTHLLAPLRQRRTASAAAAAAVEEEELYLASADAHRAAAAAAPAAGGGAAAVPASGGIARQWSAVDVESTGAGALEDVGEAADQWLVRGMQSDGLLAVVCGYAESVKVKVKLRTVDLTLVSRRSRFRSGVRFFSRGVDSEGHVSNFVETEQVHALYNYMIFFILFFRFAIFSIHNRLHPRAA